MSIKLPFLDEDYVLNRLTSFKINQRKQTGFIVEINRLLQKYQLEHILSSYLQDGVFPDKFAWKCMIKSKACKAVLVRKNFQSRINKV